MTDQVKCQDCDWTGRAEDVEPLSRAWERVQPGDIMPAGACPKCGAAAMLIDARIADNAHAIENAEAHVANIAEGFKLADQLDENPCAPVEFDGDSYTEPTEITDRLTELALSVEVRSGWYILAQDQAPEPMAKHTQHLSLIHI